MSARFGKTLQYCVYGMDTPLSWRADIINYVPTRNGNVGGNQQHPQYNPTTVNPITVNPNNPITIKPYTPITVKP